jgi:hypothetical protein
MSVTSSTESNDRFKRLTAEAEVEREREFPSTWDREQEPKLFGTVSDDRELDTKYGTRRLVTIERPDGSACDVWVTPARLREEWEAADPQVGDLVLVSFHGDIDIGKASPMADIRVRVDRGGRSEIGDELP